MYYNEGFAKGFQNFHRSLFCHSTLLDFCYVFISIFFSPSSIVRIIKLRRLKVMWPCNLCREHMMYIRNFGGEIQKKATTWNK